MSHLKGWHYSLLITLFAVLALGTTAHAASITGLIAFDTDAAGNIGAGRAWNTQAGGPYNLYITDTTIGGAFINWDDDANTSINYALTPGSYQFFMWGQAPVTEHDPYYGLNIFFDGDNTNPGISVFTGANTSDPTPPHPAISANGAASTPDLGNVGGQPAANSLIYNDGSVIVTLTDFWYSYEDVRNTDRVLPNDDAPGSGDDFSGSFSVTVTAVPEPSSAALLYFGAMSIALIRRKQRKT